MSTTVMLSREALADVPGAFAQKGLIKEKAQWSQIVFETDEDGNVVMDDNGAAKVQEVVEYEADVYIRPLSFLTATAELDARQSSNNAVAIRIASSVCDEKGNPIFTVGDVTGEADPERGPLSQNLTMALLAAIAKANDLTKKPKRPSPTKKNSGTTSSPAASAAGRSRTRKSG